MTVETNVMEVKKTQQTTAPVTKESSIKTKGFGSFIGDIKDEFSKITWTSPGELRAYTQMVVGATFLLGLGIYFIDLGIQAVLGLLAIIFHFIFG